jgi:hypothetical protein
MVSAPQESSRYIKHTKRFKFFHRTVINVDDQVKTFVIV